MDSQIGGSPDTQGAFKAGVHDGYHNKPYTHIYRKRSASYRAYEEGRSVGQDLKRQGLDLKPSNYRTPARWSAGGF